MLGSTRFSEYCAACHVDFDKYFPFRVINDGDSAEGIKGIFAWVLIIETTQEFFSECLARGSYPPYR